jgi:hypothetical protein
MLSQNPMAINATILKIGVIPATNVNAAESNIQMTNLFLTDAEYVRLNFFQEPAKQHIEKCNATRHIIACCVEVQLEDPQRSTVMVQFHSKQIANAGKNTNVRKSVLFAKRRLKLELFISVSFKKRHSKNHLKN